MIGISYPKKRQTPKKEVILDAISWLGSYSTSLCCSPGLGMHIRIITLRVFLLCIPEPFPDRKLFIFHFAFFWLVGSMVRIVLWGRLISFKTEFYWFRAFQAHIVLFAHHSVFLRDTVMPPIVTLMERLAIIPHVSQMSDLPFFFQGNVTPI